MTDTSSVDSYSLAVTNVVILSHRVPISIILQSIHSGLY